jgi:hypothetical protein
MSLMHPDQIVLLDHKYGPMGCLGLLFVLDVAVLAENLSPSWLNICHQTSELSKKKS